MPFLGKLIIYDIVLLTVLCVCVTCYHIVLINSGSRCEDSQQLSLINILSIVNNMGKLNEDKGEEDLKVLNGIKVLSMMFMVTAHRVGMTFGGMLYNPTFAEEGIEGRNILLIKSTVVDTYFAISGFLVFTFGYNQFKAQGIKMIPLAFMYRWLRLMPAYMAMLAFIIHALPYLEEGPVWQSVAVKESENCRRHWWTNFLGINNIVAADEMCLVHSWYVSCDLQLIIIGSVLVYVFSKNHMSGLILAVMALMASIIVPFRNVYVNRYEGIIKLYQSFLVDPVKDTAFREFYIQSWNRAGPFFVGIIAGYILMQIKNEKLRLSMPKRWFALCIAVIVGFGAQVPGWAFYDNDRSYNPLEHALYASLHRTLWAVLICAVIVIQLGWGFGEAVEQILSHKFYTPLSRLIYQVYLIHGVWELFHLASLRHPLYVSVPHFATLVAGDFLLSNLLGLWLYLIIDRPAGNLRSYLIERISRPRLHWWLVTFSYLIYWDSGCTS
ncbi:O-acyltransferase like protein [Bemisia tabaci]|uniref:O-acyltransferase like protein n=1 Tax=Bemisia tabaci TaxID=7038 RepID=UPI003B28A8D5